MGMGRMGISRYVFSLAIIYNGDMAIRSHGCTSAEGKKEGS
jgi:hypothetical protein